MRTTFLLPAISQLQLFSTDALAQPQDPRALALDNQSMQYTLRTFDMRNSNIAQSPPETIDCCPLGSKHSNGQCVPDDGRHCQMCRPGYLVDLEGNCILDPFMRSPADVPDLCLPGYVPDEGGCTLVRSTVSEDDEDGGCTLGPEYNLSGVPDDECLCLPGYILGDGSTLDKESNAPDYTNCSPGYFFDGRECVEMSPK
ncbi:hypothetical protein BDV25DRAFT_138161 [Aspergillus avenaceus]|uniref:Uncharacterized protein n=1 Tax=Aspergillus avenaceus TaxID=36643 RepID=A0A5N6U0M7_ASPAV|nr:hypothetical protein BDV25DRAFT_138161 [Aspergillus avenaceus]